MSEAEQETDNQEIAKETESSEIPVTDGDVTAESTENEETAQTEEELDPLDAAVLDAANWRDVALRAKAELENFRKRMARERLDLARYANAELLETLLPVLDNFEFGLQAAKAEEGSSIYFGMQMVMKQIEEFLTAQGVEVIDAGGQAFDPNVHDAVAQESSDDVPEGTIISQLRKGYRLHDRLLRPASVHVSTGPAVEGANPAEEGEAQSS